MGRQSQRPHSGPDHRFTLTSVRTFSTPGYHRPGVSVHPSRFGMWLDAVETVCLAWMRSDADSRANSVPLAWRDRGWTTLLDLTRAPDCSHPPQPRFQPRDLRCRGSNPSGDGLPLRPPAARSDIRNAPPAIIFGGTCNAWIGIVKYPGQLTKAHTHRPFRSRSLGECKLETTLF